MAHEKKVQFWITYSGDFYKEDANEKIKEHIRKGISKIDGAKIIPTDVEHTSYRFLIEVMGANLNQIKKRIIDVLLVGERPYTLNPLNFEAPYNSKLPSSSSILSSSTVYDIVTEAYKQRLEKWRIQYERKMKKEEKNK